MSGVLITNGGPHSPEKWAVATAEMIVPIAPEMSGDRLLAAKELQVAIIKVLVPHHAKVQQVEKAALAKLGDERLDAPHDEDIDPTAAIEAIQAAAEGTPWEDHFLKPEVIDAIGHIIASHFATASDIERQYHCHRNPRSAVAAKWLAGKHPQPSPDAQE